MREVVGAVAADESNRNCMQATAVIWDSKSDFLSLRSWMDGHETSRLDGAGLALSVSMSPRESLAKKDREITVWARGLEYALVAALALLINPDMTKPTAGTGCVTSSCDQE
jgi:hypothetical protein